MYQAGIYCRISIEEQNKEGEYSNSIHSQIQMARDYIAENKDIAEKKVYVDDGASGSNFERTEFRRMLADIELGVINMVIFKDVSRHETADCVMHSFCAARSNPRSRITASSACNVL